jgi:hypothetical protein
VVRRHSAALALAVAAIGVTGCGGSGSDVPPPAAAPAPVTAPASTQGQSGGGGVAVDLDQQRAATKRSLRTWGRAASRACRKSQRRMEPWERQLESMTSAKPTRARVASMGKLLARGARSAEYEYDLLRSIELPGEADAVHSIYTFLEMEEEALRLVQRLAAEVTALDDPESILLVAKRAGALADDYRRAARAVHAGACAAS